MHADERAVGRGISRCTAAAALAALVALALTVRLRGIDFLLPHFTHLDGSILFAQVDLIRSGAAEPWLHPQWGYYPHLLSEIVARLPDPDSVPLPAGASLEEHLERAAAPILQIRLVAALASVLLVPGTYALARRFVSRAWALCAAGWMATSSLVTSFAQQDRPHGLAAPLALLAVLAALRMRRKGRPIDLALAGAAAALAIAALQYDVFVLGALAVAAFFAVRSRRDEGASWLAWILAASIAVASIAGAVRVFYPFYFQGAPQSGSATLALSGEEGDLNFNISGQWVYLAHFNGRGFPVLASALVSYDPVLTACAIAGALAWLVARFARRPAEGVERRRDAWVAAAYALPFAAAIGTYRFSGERFLLPLMPYVAVLGACGLARAGAWLPPSRTARALAALGLVLVLQVPPAVFALKMGSVRAADDTYERAADWLDAHARTGEDKVVALPYLELPLFHTEDLLRRETVFSYWQRYEAALAPGAITAPRFDYELPSAKAEAAAEYGEDPLAHLRAIGADYVVIQHVGPRFRHELVLETRAALAQSAVQEARFTPLAADGGASVNNSIRFEASPLSELFVSRMLRSRCMGPTIEIYRLSGERGDSK